MARQEALALPLGDFSNTLSDTDPGSRTINKKHAAGAKDRKYLRDSMVKNRQPPKQCRAE
jgi:hypothetical protein